MSKKISVVIGHPFAGSFNHALAEVYVETARNAGASVRVIDLASEQFELSPRTGRAELRARDAEEIAAKGLTIQSLVQAVSEAEHLVFFHPSWWGTYPAVLKGFIDRVFMSGVGFAYDDSPKGWTPLFLGKTARIVTTMDVPLWVNRWWYRDPSGHSLKYAVLWYTGIKTRGVTQFSSVRSSSASQRAKWLQKTQALAQKDATVK